MDAFIASRCGPSKTIQFLRLLAKAGMIKLDIDQCDNTLELLFSICLCENCIGQSIMEPSLCEMVAIRDRSFQVVFYASWH
jgi:hypothetical protein